MIRRLGFKALRMKGIMNPACGTLCQLTLAVKLCDCTASTVAPILMLCLYQYDSVFVCLQEGSDIRVIVIIKSNKTDWVQER